LIKDLASQSSELAMLVLSTHDEGLYAERSLHAGARGYIMKSAPTDQILHAIRWVLSGKIFLSERMNDHVLGRLARTPAARRTSDLELLSDRELEVFTLIGQGRTTAQIAAALKLSPNTVATHRAHLQQKLRVETLNELVCRAVQWAQGQV
jgi:DNA-binding NarL/FixJ family response regulator